MMMAGLKFKMPAIFCGLKSQIRFYSKLTLIESELFKTVVLPYNAGNLQQPPQKNTTCRGGTRSTNELNGAISNERLFPVSLQIDFQFTLRAYQQLPVFIFGIFHRQTPEEDFSRIYRANLMKQFFFADEKGLQKKLNAGSRTIFQNFYKIAFSDRLKVF